MRPQQAGEPGHNKSGKNGRTLNKKIREWLDERDGNSTRIVAVLLAAFENARTPEGTQDRRTLIEQYFGKARPQTDKRAAQLELAEHLRCVSADQWHVIIQAMGDKIKGVDPKEAAKMVGEAIATANSFSRANTDPRRFLQAALEYLNDREEEAPPEEEAKTEEPRQLEDGQPERGDDDAT